MQCIDGITGLTNELVLKLTVRVCRRRNDGLQRIGGQASLSALALLPQPCRKIPESRLNLNGAEKGGAEVGSGLPQDPGIAP